MDSFQVGPGVLLSVGFICVYMCLSHPSSSAEYEKYQEKRLLILRNLWPSYRTQRNRTSRQAQCINSICSRHFISSELPEAKHWLEKCSGLCVNLRVCTLEKVEPNHTCKILGIMSFAYENHYCTINFTLKPFFCSRWHFIFSKWKVERTRMS